MKSHFTIYFLLLITFSFSQHSQTHWKSELDFGDGFSMTTFLKVDKTNNKFTITSPKNADVRLFGGFKAKLGRILGKFPKKGFLLTIVGHKKADSILGDTKLPVFGNLKFQGEIKLDTLTGVFIKNDTIKLGSLFGVKSLQHRINYAHLYPKILNNIENHIYSKEVLKTKQWKKFKNKLKKLCNNATDDIELFLGFNILSQNLPFSHLSLFISEEPLEEEIFTNKKSVFFVEKSKNIAYLKINNFSTSKNELERVLPIIVNNNYENLIVDLRDNGGGGLDAAFSFAKYITKKDVEVGYFVTNKLNYSGFQQNIFNNLPELQPQSNKEFSKYLRSTQGAKLIFKQPNNTVFSGKIYVLTNSKTGSTCEPIVYLLKTSKRAIIVGENTAGAMLSAAPFVIFDKYQLFLPIADFYTYDGVRLEGVGVKPDIETTSDEALNKALALIKEQK